MIYSFSTFATSVVSFLVLMEEMNMRLKFYLCEKCGNLVEMVNESGMSMMCCGQNMTELKPGTTDGASEKHVPVVSIDGKCVKVTVGEIEHPMTNDHYIEWIAIETKCGSQMKKLKPGCKPKACFELSEDDEFIAAYSYCNLHGLWIKKCKTEEKNE